MITKKQEEIISNIHNFVESRYAESNKENMFKSHVLDVVKFAKNLSEEYKGNTFVVVPAAYLHDIKTLPPDCSSIHEITGCEFAKGYLKQFNISYKEINLVSLCILHHRGRESSERKFIEEKIVACADAMGHINQCLDTFLRIGKETSLYNALERVKEDLQKNWEKIELEKAKQTIKSKYDAARVLFEF
jgi:HD superfamily phosphodiesterase